MDEPGAKLIKNKRENAQFTNIKNEREDITRDPTDSKKIIREYHKQLYADKLNNLDEMNKFFESHKLPKLIQEEIDSLNSPICLLKN